MASRKIEDLHAAMQPVAKEFLRKADEILGKEQAFITDGYRSNAEQTKLYAQGRTKPGKIVTYAKAGQSPHNYGLAIDVAFRDDGTNQARWTLSNYNKLKSLARNLGLTWGGEWKFRDNPHFELKNWKNIKDKKETMPKKTEAKLPKNYSEIVGKSSQRDYVVAKYDLKIGNSDEQELYNKVNSMLSGQKGEVSKKEKEISRLNDEIKSMKEAKPTTIERLSSRKWISALIAVLVPFINKYSGIDLDPTELMIAITGILAFIGVEGYTDYMDRLGGKRVI